MHHVCTHVVWGACTVVFMPSMQPGPAAGVDHSQMPACRATVQGEGNMFQSIFEALQYCGAMLAAYYLILVAYTAMINSGTSPFTCSEPVSVRRILRVKSAAVRTWCFLNSRREDRDETERQVLRYLFRVSIHRNVQHAQKNVISHDWRMTVGVHAPGVVPHAGEATLPFTLQQLIDLGIAAERTEATAGDTTPTSEFFFYHPICFHLPDRHNANRYDVVDLPAARDAPCELSDAEHEQDKRMRRLGTTFWLQPSGRQCAAVSFSTPPGNRMHRDRAVPSCVGCSVMIQAACPIVQLKTPWQ